MDKSLQTLLVFLILVSSGFGLSCNSGYTGPVESVSIGTTASEVNALIRIALNKDYFTRNGIKLTHKIYASGVAALDGMFKHEVDIATGSEFAFAGEALSGKSIRALCAINRPSSEYLVGRIDRGINTIADLKGKVIGVPLGSRPEFALDRFLLFHGINTSGVTLVNVPVNQSVNAIVSGRVDAVASWQPYIDQIKANMGSSVVIWDVQEDQPSFTLAMSTEKWTSENPQLVIRLLKSLLLAENYIIHYPEEAKAIIRQELNYDDAYLASVWPYYNFSVSLDQALVAAMEDQARWIIEKNLTLEKQTPNFINLIYLNGLEAVKPEAVNIIR